MSKRSNKRAKKLDQDKLFDNYVQLDQQEKVSKLDDEDLFYVAPSKSTVGKKGQPQQRLTEKELQRRAEIHKMLFGNDKKATEETEGKKKKAEKVYDPLAKTPKPIQGLKPNQKKLAKNKLRREQEAAEMAQWKAEQARAYEERQNRMADDEDDEDDEDEDDEEEEQDSEENNTFTGYGLTTPIDVDAYKKLPKYRVTNKYGKKFIEPKQVVQEKDYPVEEHHGVVVKPTIAAVARTFYSGTHYDHLDMDRNGDEEIDLWDQETVQQNAEDKAFKRQERSNRLARFDGSIINKQDEEEVLETMMKGAMKNKRNAKTSIHIKNKALIVAPSGLSINPVREDMDMLLDVYKRRVVNEQAKAKKLERAWNGDYKIPFAHNMSAKEKAKMAKMYEPIPREPTLVKIKTKTERNAEKKKAKVRYEHAMLRKNKRFNDNLNKIREIVAKLKKHEKYVEEKLPEIRKEVAEVRDALPKKFGKKRYQTPLSLLDLQTPQRLESSEGQLRKSHMSTNLLADSFGHLQRANMIPAKVAGGKKAVRREYKMKSARAAGVRMEEQDIDAIIKNAEEKARLQPHVPTATKNPKRKLEEVYKATKTLTVGGKGAKKAAKAQKESGSTKSSKNDGYNDDIFNEINAYAYDENDLWA